MLRVVEGISRDELLWIPPGFRNNILWNLGHTLVVQQIFNYRRAGLPLRVPEDQAELFGSGTSPSNWDVVPDVAELLRLLDETSRLLADDYRAGQFTDYQSFSTKSGVQIANIDDAPAFNQFHEGLHSGVIECMRRLWSHENGAATG
jgi:hypothetical protein